jgi:hypothetical protein
MTHDLALPNESEWRLLMAQSSALLKSKFLPQSLQTPEQVIVVVLKGRELAIPPMQALSHINVIQGKPCMSAELMFSMILQKHPRTRLKIVERTDRRCEIEVTREGWEAANFAWTIEQAQNAGLLTKSSWKQYPKAMLYWRTISEMARSLFPDALAGTSYTPEELGAEIDDKGTIINVQKIERADPRTELTLTQRWQQWVIHASQFGLREEDLEQFVGTKDPETLTEDAIEALKSFIADKKRECENLNKSAKDAFGV